MSEGNVVVNALECGNINLKTGYTQLTVDADLSILTPYSIKMDGILNDLFGIHRRQSTVQQYISDNVVTKLNFNYEDINNSYNSIGDWNDSTYEFTISYTGWYKIETSLNFGTSFDNRHTLQIYKNGTPQIGQSQTFSTGLNSYIHTSLHLYLQNGDIIDLRCIQTSGSARRIQNSYFVIYTTGLISQDLYRPIEYTNTFSVTAGGTLQTGGFVAKTTPLRGTINVIDKLDLNSGNIFGIGFVTFQNSTNIILDNNSSAGSAAGATAIAIGRAVNAAQSRGIAIGNGAKPGGTDGACFGTSSEIYSGKARCVAIGHLSKMRLSESVAIGYNTGSLLLNGPVAYTAGAHNVVIGSAAAPNMKGRKENIAIGRNAGASLGNYGTTGPYGAGPLGCYNIVIGKNADTHVWARYHVCIGRSANATRSGGNSQATVMGRNAFTAYNSASVLGYAGNAPANDAMVVQKRAFVGTTAVWSGNEIGITTSTGRFKKNIRPLEDMGNKIDQLRLVRFEPAFEGDTGTGLSLKKEYIGLIAEELEAIFPEFVGYDEDGVTPNAVHYPELSAIAWREVQSLRQRVAALESM